MFDGSDPCWVPTVPVTENRKVRAKITAFGDGYEQHTLDGINPISRAWSLSWENRPAAELLAMEAYLSDKAMAPFPFLDPASGVLYSVICSDWQINWSPRRRKAGAWLYYGSLSATFTKANGISI